MHTFNVCEVINTIYGVTKDKQRERHQLMQHVTGLEGQRDKIIDECRVRGANLTKKLEKLIDSKIQLDLDLNQMENLDDRAIQKAQVEIDKVAKQII